MQVFSKKHAPWLPTVVKFFGDIGAGEPYFFASLVLVITGHHYEFNKFLVTFLFCLVLNHVLKLAIMHPRPYFLNKFIAQSEVLDCSAEFGNPSGHSVMAATVFFFYRHSFFKNGLKNLIFTLFMMLAIGMSRVFGGMHSLDQLILGWSIGYWCFSFSNKFLVPHFVNKFTVTARTDAWEAFMRGLVFTLMTYLTIFFLVFYLEGQVPLLWHQNVEYLCPNLESAEKFHTHALNGSGHIIILTSLPFGALIGQKLFKTSFEFDNRKKRSWTQIIVALLMFLLLDEFFGSLLPQLLFGTKNLDIIKDLVFKKMGFGFSLGILTNGFLNTLVSKISPLQGDATI